MMTNKLVVSLLYMAAAVLVMTNAYAEEGAAKMLQSPSTKDVLEQIRKDARNDFQHTAQALRALDSDKMNAEDRATWVRLSRESAVRNGDLTTLKALKNQADPFSLQPLSRILLANAFINEADLQAARSELEKLGKLEDINTRDQRRYWALKARIAQLEGKSDEERSAIEHIVHELSHWSSANCQSCHNDLKNPQTIPLLEIQSSWYGKRFVELMQKQGDSEEVRRNAEKVLAKTPENMNARIFQCFSLQALERQAETEQCWKEIPWVGLPGRNGVSPRMMFAWP